MKYQILSFIFLLFLCTAAIAETNDPNVRVSARQKALEEERSKAIEKAYPSVGIFNSCAYETDEEDQYWCYFDLAITEKNITYCESMSWLNTRECIDEVKKVASLTPQNCSEFKSFKSYCEEYLKE